MVPAAVVDKAIADLPSLLEAGDILIDGGNPITWMTSGARKNWRRKEFITWTWYKRRCWGLERGYCMMIGGEDVVERLDPIFSTLAPGIGNIPRSDRSREARRYRRTRLPALWSERRGPFRQNGSQRHEYGIMAAYAEGLGVLNAANAGTRQMKPTRRPHRCAIRSTINMTSTSPDIAEVWRRGSVIASWLLDLTASALLQTQSSRNSPAEFPTR